MPWPWKTSFILFFFGMLVAFFSLQSMHGNVVAQGFEQTGSPSRPSYSVLDLLDSQLPGTPLYYVQRGKEYVELAVKSSEKQCPQQLSRARERLTASQYAWQKEQTPAAITTLRKSYMYLSEATNSCQELTGEEATDLANDISSTIHSWQSQEKLSASQTTMMITTASQLEALRQQYHF
jgi:hypothetical protein